MPTKHCRNFSWSCRTCSLPCAALWENWKPLMECVCAWERSAWILLLRLCYNDAHDLVFVVEVHWVSSSRSCENFGLQYGACLRFPAPSFPAKTWELYGSPVSTFIWYGLIGEWIRFCHQREKIKWIETTWSFNDIEMALKISHYLYYYLMN